MPKIWRLEDKQGFGVYTAPNSPFDNEKFCCLLGLNPSSSKFNPSRHPSPRSDKLLCQNVSRLFLETQLANFQAPFVYGFSSLSQYKNWFYVKKARLMLDQFGIFLHQYGVSAENLYRGSAQICFSRPHAILLQECRPSIFG